MQNSVLGSLLADFKYRTSRKLEQLDIELEWQVDMEADHLAIKPQTGLHLLRILQEAFTNILKHSGADKIHLSAEPVGDHFRIVIEDNGQFQPQAEAVEAGHGLRNMRSRAAKLGGSLDVEAIGSGGCRIILSFPCTASP
jgi:signal transduction histidine kinase